MELKPKSRAASTTPLITAAIRTMMVYRVASARVGQVTFVSSARASLKKLSTEILGVRLAIVLRPMIMNWQAW